MAYLAKTFCAVALLATAACATSSQQLSRAATTTLAQSRQDYLAGLESLRQADYPTARERLERVARGPAYIVYTSLAKLRLADALMFEERYEEAAEAYRSFNKTALGDPNLHYSYFRLAEATFRSVPAEFFLLPPADRKDQKPIREAIKTLQEFLNRFPDSPFVLEARQMLEKMVRTAISYEMEVARFYRTRDRPRGTVRRLERLLADFPQAEQAEEVRAALIDALAAAGETERCARECADYLGRFPKARRKVVQICTPLLSKTEKDSEAKPSGASDEQPDFRR